MHGIRGVPPGRAGRLWLRRRLEVATRSREQLDRTLHLIELERHRLLALEEAHGDDWHRACAEGATWLARAAVLTGRDGIRTATPPASLTAEVGWATTAGVVHPLEVTVARAGAPQATLLASSALAPARDAYERALAAGAALAGVQAGLRSLERQASATRRRLRGLDKRWIPRLRQSLRELEAALEQGEREDRGRLRGSAGTAFGP
ncbi:V-type ATP synthase subunit D [Pedococcus sp. NPDC057267]|uniref:V-type ATP synthase subunit D n=1 Tax=Pedococcus sp. NPDC057267 TaxID=3346077 RepID=UPI00362F8264